MSPDSWLKLLKQHRVIAVIRASDCVRGQRMAQAANCAGIRLIEITWNSVHAAELIATLRHDLPDCIVGTGTVLDQVMLNDALTAGAQFVFSPHVNLHLIRAAVEQDIPIIPGALTPTEIITAWQAGAYSVKVFPVSAVGGTRYIQSLQGPLKQIPLIPTGGVTVHNAKAFLDAGAIAVGISSHLFPNPLVESGNWDMITHRAMSLMASLMGSDVSMLRK